jgi:hypothetical protein
MWFASRDRKLPEGEGLAEVQQGWMEVELT